MEPIDEARHVIEDLQSQLSQAKQEIADDLSAIEDIRQIKAQLSQAQSDRQFVWDRLQKLSPWCESNDMEWADEIDCGFNGVEQQLSQAKEELATCDENARKYLQLMDDKDKQLSKWQECAKRLYLMSQELGLSNYPDDAIALFTQLTGQV